MFTIRASKIVHVHSRHDVLNHVIDTSDLATAPACQHSQPKSGKEQYEDLHSNLVEVAHHVVIVFRLRLLEVLENRDMGPIGFAIARRTEILFVAIELAVEEIF